MCYRRVAWWKVAFAHFEAIARKPFGFLVLRLIGAQQRSCRQAFSYETVVRAVQLFALLQRRTKQSVCALKLPKLLIDNT